MSTSAQPTQLNLQAGKVAAAFVGLETIALAGFAVFYAYELIIGAGSDPVIVLMSIVLFVVFIVGFSYVSYGLWTRNPRAQAPAIAANGLLIPLGIAMFQFAPPIVAGAILVTGLTVVISALAMGSLD